MKTNFKKISALFLVLIFLFCSVSVFAEAENEKFEILIEDITSAESRLELKAAAKIPVSAKGEAKILISTKGVIGKVENIQTSISFSGNMKYKGIQYIKGENNPPECIIYTPSSSLVNINGKLSPFIVSRDGISFEEDVTPLYVLTFIGEPGSSLSVVNVDTDKDRTYCVTAEKELTADNIVPLLNVVPSEVDVAEKNAVIRLTMDKVTSFSAVGDEQYKNSNVSLKITNEQTGYTIYTVLNDNPVSSGGHRENVPVPTFTVSETVLANDSENNPYTYTVELSGPGYTSVVRNNVVFDSVINITNADFKPGDLNGDNNIDDEDKAILESMIEDEELFKASNRGADFNRDGRADIIDKKIFELQTGKTDVKLPSKMNTPTLSAASNSVSVSWQKPDDSTVTGYKINYGTSQSDMNSEININSADTLSSTISNLTAGSTYYVKIAAVNEAGVGEYSDAASVQTTVIQIQQGGTVGGGATGGGGAAGGGAPAGGSTSTENTPSNTESFKDLSGYDWAKAAIYALKNKGIINGTSESSYSPSNNIKRGDFILILSRMLDFDGEDAGDFADVPKNSYYYNAIKKAKAAGIATGDGKGFRPEDSISRQDLITLSYRAFLLKGYISENKDMTSINAFKDKNLIADYALDAMASMVNAGIIKGNDGNVNPKGNATRAEVAVMCERLLKLIK